MCASRGARRIIAGFRVSMKGNNASRSVRHLPGGPHAPGDRVLGTEAAGEGRVRGDGPGGADLLRPAGLQLPARARGRARPAEKFLREFEMFDYVVVPSALRRHDPPALWRPAARRPGTERPLRAPARARLRTDRLPRQRGRPGDPRLGFRRTHHLSRFLLGLRELGVKAQPRALLAAAGRAAHRDEGLRSLLRFRRYLLGQVRQYLDRHRRREVRQYPGQRRRRRGAGRSRLHPQYRRPPAPYRRRTHARAAHRPVLAGDA